jgi:hypothetical protein
MQDILKQFEIKKILKEYEYLNTEEEYGEMFIKEHRQNFLTEISKRRMELGIPNPHIKDPIIPEEIEQSPDNRDIEEIEYSEETPFDKKLKRIFKEIAKKVHPDKELDETKKENCQKKYIKARSLMDEKDLMGLYVMSIELGIEVEIDDSDLERLYGILTQKKEKIKTLETSYLWLWVKGQTLEEKIKIIDLFISTNG